MLDDECRLPKGSDRKWCGRLYKQYLNDSSVTRFSATSKNQSDSIFCIRHFAGVVEYSAETGFCEKNKDKLPLAANDVFSANNGAAGLLLEVFEGRDIDNRKESASEGRSGKSKPPPTVGSQFKESLSNLLKKIEATGPHYIRCLKPNDEARPDCLVRSRLIEQLKYGGVLEAVRVARSGYPVRFDHNTFYERYRVMLRESSGECRGRLSDGATRQDCIALLAEILSLPDHPEKQFGGGASGGRASMIRSRLPECPPLDFEKKEVQLGATKVFMRKAAHNILESNRSSLLTVAVIHLQSSLRGLIMRKIYLYLRSSVVFVQKTWRGYLGRMVGKAVRESKAAVVLTRTLKMLFYARRFKRLVRSCTSLQRKWLKLQSARLFAAVKLQSIWRMWDSSGKVFGFIKCMVVLQNRCRRMIALRAFKELKADMRNVGKLQEERERLKSEMSALKAMLKTQAKSERKGVEMADTENAMASEVKALKAKCAALTRANNNLRQELEKEGERENIKPGDAAQATEITKLKGLLEKERKRRRAAEAEVSKLRSLVVGESDVVKQLASYSYSYSDEEDKKSKQSKRKGDSEDLSHSPETIATPVANGPRRGDLKRGDGMEMGSKMRDDIIQNSQKLIEEEAKKVRNVGTSEDWGKAWDEDSVEVEDEASRMQRVMKLRCVSIYSFAIHRIFSSFNSLHSGD